MIRTTPINFLTSSIQTPDLGTLLRKAGKVPSTRKNEETNARKWFGSLATAANSATISFRGAER